MNQIVVAFYIYFRSTWVAPEPKLPDQPDDRNADLSLGARAERAPPAHELRPPHWESVEHLYLLHPLSSERLKHVLGIKEPLTCLTIVVLQGFLWELLLRRAAWTPSLYRPTLWDCPLLQNGNICKSSKWAGRCDLAAHYFGACQRR